MVAGTSGTAERQQLQRHLAELRDEYERLQTALERLESSTAVGSRARVKSRAGHVRAELIAVACRLRGEPAPSSNLAKHGRPSRLSLADPALVADAPFPELVTEPADRLCFRIRRMQDAPLLADAYGFESVHDHRRSVLRELERRLRRLGAPVPEPLRCQLAPPCRGYDGLSSSPQARKAVHDRLTVGPQT